MLIHVKPEKSVFNPDLAAFCNEVYSSLKTLSGCSFNIQDDLSAVFSVSTLKVAAFCNVVENCGVFQAELHGGRLQPDIVQFR